LLAASSFWVAAEDLLFGKTAVDAAGTLYRVVHGKSKAVYVARTVADGWPAADVQAAILRDAATLLRLRHPHLVQCVGLSRAASGSVVLLCGGIAGACSSLDVWLYERQHRFCEETRFEVAHSVASALAYLHAHRVVHRDVRSDTVLLDGEGKHAKLGVPQLRDIRTPPVSALMYVAPEILLGEAEDRHKRCGGGVPAATLGDD
jgi:serine/threonine protein kinase